MYILGIWDGHDSGAAIVKNDKILVAINEERLSRRKLDIGFPQRSILACLEHLNLVPNEIQCIAASTSDFAKTLTRIFPSMRKEYYLLRRRKKAPGIFSGLKKLSKYKLTEIGPTCVTKYISKVVLMRELRKSGFTNTKIYLIDHHLCHTATAAFCSGFKECAIVSLDGIGDGLSGSISVLKDHKLSLVNTISGKTSLGIFFEHVTNLLNMRELEDEGKVMALANYAFPIRDEENPLLDFFNIDGVDVIAKYSSIRMYKKLKEILWGCPSEQFAYLAQRTLEIKVPELVRNVMTKTGQQNIALAGGVFSNIKINMLIRELPDMSGCFIFPHMGDGGLALGAALCANYDSHQVTSYNFDNVFLGTEYKDDVVEQILIKHRLQFEKKDDIAYDVAHLIAKNEIVFWFQARMEYGPRALGHRSILALPDSEKIKNQLNLKLKMRVWYQPFCPSVLEEDAEMILESYSGEPNRYMTMAYSLKPEWVDRLKGITSIDGTCRPQIVDKEDNIFYKLLKKVKELTGIGVILNTSLNIHGDPMVCSPEDAVDAFIKTKNDYMAINNYLVIRKDY